MKTFVLMLLAAPALAAPLPDEAALKKVAGRFAPVELAVDLTKLTPNEQKVLGKLVAAAKIMDALFLLQVSADNQPLLLDLAADNSPLGRARLHNFLLFKGPWNRLEHDAPFLPGVGPKPPEANFYPAGATKAAVESWQKSLSEKERAAAVGFYTTIRKSPSGSFVVVPYSLEYQGELARASELLREAAALADDPTLRKFLSSRADAFVSNDYYASDVAWMQLTSRVEPTIGPYEVYEDDWFNAKAAFEAFINVRDDAETDKLARFSAELQDIENHLPIDAALKNPKLGASAPIRVVNELYCAGDAAHGVQTAAYNLPNDERIEKELGTKRVMLKNVQEAKFEKVLRPIARVVLGPADQKNVAFDVFFTHILMHELMHGLGPHMVGKQTVRELMQDSYSALEEAKADISGLFAMQLLVDKGVLPKTMERTMYTTYLASSFRSIRFGATEAHARGQAMQLNWLVDKGGVVIGKDGTFAVDPGHIKAAVTSLTTEILTLQGRGDRAGAQQLLQKMAVIRPPIQALLDRLKDVPIDIEPRFVSADKL
jgi:Peptidase family M49